MKTIALLPLDDRPVTYDAPRRLGRIAGVEVITPPRDWTGTPWREARHADLVRWLEDSARSADALVIAADSLAYGGLIPSRRSGPSLEEARARLDLLRRLKSQRPGLAILASSVIQRVSRDNSAEEEQPYWADYGAHMFRLSYLEHKSALDEASPEESAERDGLAAAIPAGVVADYKAIRARNHAVNLYMLDQASDGIVDTLLLPQDDTAAYGWNIAEARYLQASIRARGLTGQAITYPGADEIGSLLVAAWLCREMDFHPRVYPRFSSAASAQVVTDYEDRPMLELLKAHLAPLGGVVAEDPGQADLHLFINAPALRQGSGLLQWAAQFSPDELRAKLDPALDGYLDGLFREPDFQATRREMQTPLRSPEEFSRAILAALRTGLSTAVADVAFVNGADLILSQQLFRSPEVLNLAAYGGWNTAGNTLGMVLAQFVCWMAANRAGWGVDQERAQLEFLLLRFLDDYAYQAVERSRLMLEDLPNLGLQPTTARLPDGEITARITERAAERMRDRVSHFSELLAASGRAPGVHLAGVSLPWQRLFEIRLDLDLEPVNPGVGS